MAQRNISSVSLWTPDSINDNTFRKSSPQFCLVKDRTEYPVLILNYELFQAWFDVSIVAYHIRSLREEGVKLEHTIGRLKAELQSYEEDMDEARGIEEERGETAESRRFMVEAAEQFSKRLDEHSKYVTRIRSIYRRLSERRKTYEMLKDRPVGMMESALHGLGVIPRHPKYPPRVRIHRPVGRDAHRAHLDHEAYDMYSDDEEDNHPPTNGPKKAVAYYKDDPVETWNGEAALPILLDT